MIAYKGINMITCGHVNCYIIRGEKGDILIDTGTPDFRGIIETWLFNYHVTLIILTHGHNDHIGNAAYFSELFGAPIMISPYDMRLCRSNLSRRSYALTAAGRLMMTANNAVMQKKSELFSPDIFAADDMELSPYGIDGRIINLEGHTKGSIGVLCSSSLGCDLYVGDAVMNMIRPSMPMIAESPKQAHRTVRRIMALSPDRILSGHGKPVITRNSMEGLKRLCK